MLVSTIFGDSEIRIWEVLWWESLEVCFWILINLVIIKLEQFFAVPSKLGIMNIRSFCTRQFNRKESWDKTSNHLLTGIINQRYLMSQKMIQKFPQNLSSYDQSPSLSSLSILHSLRKLTDLQLIKIPQCFFLSFFLHSAASLFLFFHLFIINL